MTYFNNNYHLTKKTLKFLTIYDLIHEKFPHYYSKTYKEFTLKKKKRQLKKQII